MIKNKGFTLIELLVVIAIIGILSSVVLASLNIARGRGSDAKTKAQLASAKNSAQIFYDEYGSYNGIAGDVEFDCETTDSMFQDTTSNMISYTDLTNYPAGTQMRCSSTDDSFVISASLQDVGEFWCIDSSGNSKQLSPVDDLHSTAHPDDATSC